MSAMPAPQIETSRDVLPLLKGANIIVTGAASGMGKELAIFLGRSGANLALTDVNAEAGEATVSTIKQFGAKVSFSALDCSNGKAVAKFVAEAASNFEGGLHGIAHAAGWMPPDHPTVEDMSEEFLDKMLAINVKGSFLFAQAAVKAFKKQGRSQMPEGGYSIVLFGSVAGNIGWPGASSYCASKSAVHGLVRSLAKEVGKDGIRVNAIAPGGVNTPLLQRLIEKHGEASFPKSLVPLGRAGEPQELIRVVAFLLSAHASYTHGSIWQVDGAWTS